MKPSSSSRTKPAKKTGKASSLSKALNAVKRKLTRRTNGKHSFPALEKPSQNPIIAPMKQNGWEMWQTFNPGAIALKNKVHFLYRAIVEDRVSRLGYALSRDGLTVNERGSNPAYEHRISPSPFSMFSFASGG